MRVRNRLPGTPATGLRPLPGRRWFSVIAAVAFIGVVSSVALRPRPADPAVVAQIRCYATAVALNEALLDRPAPEWRAAFDARFAAMRFPVAEMARLRSRHAALVGPAVARAQEARDAAIANDSETYLTEAWAAVRACPDAPSGTA